MIFIDFRDKRGQLYTPLTIINYSAGIKNLGLVCILISSEPPRLQPKYNHIYTKERNLSESTSGDFIAFRIRVLVTTKHNHRNY